GRYCQASPPSSSLTSFGALSWYFFGNHRSHKSGGSITCESAETRLYSLIVDCSCAQRPLPRRLNDALPELALDIQEAAQQMTPPASSASICVDVYPASLSTSRVCCPMIGAARSIFPGVRE